MHHLHSFCANIHWCSHKCKRALTRQFMWISSSSSIFQARAKPTSEFYAISNLFARWRVVVFVTAHIAHSSGTCKSFSPKNLFASVISWSKSTKPGLDFMRIAHLLAKAYGYWLFIIIVLHSFRQTSMVKDRVMETKMEINKWDSFFHPFKCTDWKEKERKKSGWKTNC